MLNNRQIDVILAILEYLRDNTELDWKTWEEVEELLIKKNSILEEKDRGRILDIREHIKAKGHWEGEREGLRKGRREGRKKERQKIVLNMLKKKLNISLISEVTGLSEKGIQKLKNGS